MSEKLTEYLSSILKEVDFLQKRHSIKYDSKPLIAFRGESMDYGKTSLMPSIFRNPAYLPKEKHLFELICDYGLIDFHKTMIEKAIETQHYVEISRMLDITLNVSVALYFACAYNLEKDGFIYIFCFPEYYSPHSNYIESFYENILNSKKTKSYFKNFKVCSHSYSNDRIKAQSGGFIFFPGETFSPINSIYYKKIKINALDKKEILDYLNIAFHINEAKIFPEKDKIAKQIKEKFMSDLFSSEEVNIDSEITSCFEKISYELNMSYKKEKMELLRYLRKEKEDLLTFVSNQIQETNDSSKKSDNSDNKNKLFSKINNTFDFYSKMI